MIPSIPQDGYSYHLRVGTVFSGATVYYTDTAQPETVALWVEEMLEGEVLRAVQLASDERGSFVRVYFRTRDPLFLAQKPGLAYLTTNNNEEDVVATTDDDTYREESA